MFDYQRVTESLALERSQHKDHVNHVNRFFTCSRLSIYDEYQDMPISPYEITCVMVSMVGSKDGNGCGLWSF